MDAAEGLSDEVETRFGATGDILEESIADSTEGVELAREPRGG